MRETPAELIELVWNKLGHSPAEPAGRVRGLDFQAETIGEALQVHSSRVPYLAYQYDGGTIAAAHAGFRETERSVVYVVWHDSIHTAEKLEKQFLDDLFKTKRLVGIGAIYSFRDSSTGRPQLSTPHGIQRNILIKV